MKLVAARWLAGMACACTMSAAVAAADDDVENRVARVEHGLPAVAVDGRDVEHSLQDWMKVLRIPGMSVAVIDDYRVVWSRGYGVMAADAEVAVTPRTLFQAASIAKPVAALTLLHHVDAGDFALDADVDDYLRAWHVPAGAIAEPVTLRQLLAHTSGISPGGFAGYERGGALPTTLQVLRGEAPATNRPARRLAAPDVDVQYSGLGYTIVEQALVDRLQKPFAEIADAAVLHPLGLHDSLFAADLPQALTARAASGHRASGRMIEGGWTANPELSAAGLWTTSDDLARIAIEIAQAKAGRSRRVLSEATARQLLTPHRDAMGLGLVLRPGEHGHFAHSGGNSGYRAHVEMLADTGQGIVVMTNSDAGHLLIALMLRSVAREYGWAPPPPPLPDATLSGIVAQLAQPPVRTAIPVDAAVLARYVGRYRLAPDMEFDVQVVDGRLSARLGDQPRFPLQAESETRFFFDVVDAQLTFELDDVGAAVALVLHQGGRDQRAPRVP